jgi:hypothetical protein
MKPLTVVFLVLLASALLVLLSLLYVADALPHWGHWWQVTLCVFQAFFFLYIGGLLLCLIGTILYTIWAILAALGQTIWARLHALAGRNSARHS